MNLVEKVGDQSFILYQLFFIYNYMIFKNKYSLIMFIAIFVNFLINIITKNYLIEVMKPYNHVLPILGNFCRPSDPECKKLTSTGYGMPSGHSQFATFIPAFYYLYSKKNETLSIPTFTILILIAIFIMRTRYTSKAHTIQQIILGGSYGVLIAYVIFYIINYLGIL